MNEFDLIRRFFTRPVPPGYLGVGDDCALVPVAPGKQLATSTDLLIEGRHFLPDAVPSSLGHKALAVNLSDLAAMGAEPLGCVLGLSLPHINEPWLEAFAEGFHALAEAAHCPLVGGDTTRSPQGVVISVTVFGQVDPVKALRRSAAKPGDDIWVTGTLGAPHAALQWLTGRWPAQPALLERARPALERPVPPWRFAQHLPGLAHAALDISDGLLQDLGHILKASGCGAVLQYDKLPADEVLGPLDEASVHEALLSGGDVYQLCFTAPPGQREAIEALARAFAVKVTPVGQIETGAQLNVRAADGSLIPISSRGFDHFA